MPYVEKLKMIKEDKNLTNSEIATLSNIPLATITRVFNGQTPNPTFETISRIAIGMGVSLDELCGLKQPDAPPVPSPIENTLNSYSELLQEKDERIKELKEEKERERRDRYRMTCVLICVVVFLLVLLAFDLVNGQLGYFRR
jgi:transcriptional regulator with XRE-family HTH domain